MTARVGPEVEWAASRLAQAGVDSPMLDAQLLMAHTLCSSRLDVIAHPERVLSEAERAAFVESVERRAGRYPLAYLLGHREFYGLDIVVAPGVLIPRPETELLVDVCLKRLHGKENAQVADIGAGSGAIAVALASNLPGAKVYATEISPDALKVARTNLEKHQLAGRVELLAGDLLAPIARLGLKFDAIVSNPPYIPSDEIERLEPEVRDYEPRLALDGGPDGVDAYRWLLPESLGLLDEAGFVVVEIGAGEAEAVKTIALAAGYRGVEIRDDLAGIERVVVACA